MKEWFLPTTALLYENTRKKLIQDGQNNIFRLEAG